MKNVGIIAEYNPLHFGHLYQMSEVDNESDIIVAMSGNFTERGDTAIMNKYTRARLAVQHGASMVVEIPTLGVLSCAEHYAQCAIKVLSLLGNVDRISFGSEAGDIDSLRAIANAEESESVKAHIIEYQREGMNYPRALALAMQDIPNAESILSSPNNVLGIEYIRACNGTNITPTTIRRRGAGYNECDLTMDRFASASSIRANIMSEDVEGYLPRDVLDTAKKYSVNNDIIYQNLYQKLVVEDEDISNILGIGEGLNNRIKNALISSNSYQSLLDNIKTKRYTLSRIKRTLLAILLGIDSTLTHDIDSIDYIHVLAIREDKMSLLSNAHATIVTKFLDYKKTQHPLSQIDIKANRLYNILGTDKITSHQMQIVRLADIKQD